MTGLSEWLTYGKQHHVAVSNRQGKVLIRLSLLVTVILIIAAPQLLVVVLLDLIDVAYDGRSLRAAS